MEDEAFLKNFNDLVDLNNKQCKKVAFYARKMDVSVHLLNKTLIRIAGSHAKELIIMVVIKKAKEKLRDSDDTVKEVALALGFIDPTYFFKFFSRHVGETPLGFRKKFRETSINC